MGEKVTEYLKRDVQLFNTPIEVGLRALILLAEMRPKICNLQRLVFYDYLMLHSGDVINGPPSLHPPIPYRSCEILVRSELILKGLQIMLSKELVDIVFNDNGRYFKTTDMAVPFLRYIESEYSNSLKNNAKWIITKFNSYSDEKLELFIKENLNRWGGEFSKEYSIRGVIYE